MLCLHYCEICNGVLPLAIFDPGFIIFVFGRTLQRIALEFLVNMIRPIVFTLELVKV